MNDLLNGKPIVAVPIGRAKHDSYSLFKEEYEKVLVGEQYSGSKVKTIFF